MRPVHRTASRKGFALVVTISVLVLLALVAVGMLTLSTISVRSTGAGAATREAQANARLGLLLAIGELQRSLGPDRRVSASAGILDEVPESGGVDGVRHPHWTAVWSTAWDDGSTPWTRDDNAGGLWDRRSDAGWQAHEKVLNYLVSGNEGGRDRGDQSPPWLDARSADLGGDAIRLVGKGSVADPAEEVLVKRIPVQSQTGGTYAYWVGDLGVKALVGRGDAHGGQALGGGADGLERMVHSQDVEEELLPDFGSIGKDETQRVISRATLNLLPTVTDLGPKKNYHAITAHSRSVLANVRDGGLQRDLTAYLQSTGSIPELRDSTGGSSPGISDRDRMVGPANTQMARAAGLNWTAQRYRDIAPCFGLIRHWSDLGDQTGFTDRNVDMLTPATLRDRRVINAMTNGVNVYDNANLKPASFLPHTRANIAPVLVEGSIYYNLATFPQPSGSTSQWVLRLCLYPRVVLWNPYNVDLELPTTVAQLFINGNKQVRLTRADSSTRDVTIPFGRGSVSGNRHPNHYRGTVLWTLPAVTLGPGETLVFSPAQNGPYDLNTISNNLLSPTVAPDPTRYYYQDMERKHSQAPQSFIEYPKAGKESGADNYLMALKAGGTQNITDVAFDSLPLIVYANTSLQAGGSDELPVRWTSSRSERVHRLSSADASLGGGAIPAVRTRDGFRLRWWREHRTNELGSGRLRQHPQHLQSAIVANWNPRAAYFCRTPWENITDQPPYFYGAYTRDLFDDEVSWTGLAPRAGNGRMLGFPFGPPVEGPDALVLFEVPRKEIGIPSLGYLRHLKVSEFGWHPSYAIGNSLADPRVGRTGTSPNLSSSQNHSDGGWNKDAFGWANGRVHGTYGADYWAMLTRQILFDKPTTNNMVYDLSFELNHTLWDNFFLSTGTESQKNEFFQSPQGEPLPNGRIGLFSSDGAAKSDLTDFHRAASRLSLEGGFNVHSVSKDAWKAFLGSTRDTTFGSEGSTPFPRFLDPQGNEWMGANADSDAIWDGFRSLSDDEIDRLAEELVVEVKRRAPFFGLGDFVNRRLRDDATGTMGPLQAAIDAADLNASLEGLYPLDNTSDLPNTRFDNISDATRIDQTLKPPSTAWGIPGHLTQGDVLQVIGSSLRARSDSFVIRSYGESVASDGTIRARAWCEAIVQRVPDPVQSDSTGLNPVSAPTGTNFGRRFRPVSFRWLSADEV